MKSNVPLLFATVLAILSLAAVGCSSAAAPPSPKAAAPAAPPAAAPGSSSSSSTADSANQSTSSRMLIRTASLQLVVADVDAALSKATDLAKEMGGFVASSQSQDRNNDRVGQASLRVPVDRFDESVERLKQIATRVVSASTKDQDVTEEYVDQDAHLRNLQATEDQYLQLMKKAQTTDDIIKIQKALTDTRDQIERTQGRLQYLRRSTDMATINLDLTTSASARPVDGGSWNTQEVFSEAVQGLVGVLLVLAGLGIYVLVFVPVWVPTVLLVRWWRRRGQRRLPPVPPVAPAGGDAS